MDTEGLREYVLSYLKCDDGIEKFPFKNVSNL